MVKILNSIVTSIYACVIPETPDLLSDRGKCTLSKFSLQRCIHVALFTDIFSSCLRANSIYIIGNLKIYLWFVPCDKCSPFEVIWFSVIIVP